MATSTTEFSVEGKKLLGKVKELLHEGNVRKILITSKSGKKVVEVPVNLGVVVTLFAPILVALGALGALTEFYKVTVERDVPQKKAASTRKTPARKRSTSTAAKKKPATRRTTKSASKAAK